MATRTERIQSTAIRTAVALMFVFAFASSTKAEGHENQWQIETSIYLAGLTTVVDKGPTSTNYSAMSTLAEIEMSLPARRWYTSLFAEYRISGEDRFDNIRNFGAYWKYSLEHWDVTTYLFVNQTPQISQTWYYAGRLRYQLADDHKLGVQAAGAFERPGSPSVELGYFGSLSESLSLNLIADPGFNGGTNFAARAEIIWQVY